MAEFQTVHWSCYYASYRCSFRRRLRNEYYIWHSFNGCRVMDDGDWVRPAQLWPVSLTLYCTTFRNRIPSQCMKRGCLGLGLGSVYVPFRGFKWRVLLRHEPPLCSAWETDSGKPLSPLFSRMTRVLWWTLVLSRLRLMFWLAFLRHVASTIA